MSSTLYYLLTTGAGLQTLGEEYCDVLQMAGRPPVPLAAASACAVQPAAGASPAPVFDMRGPVAPAARVALALLQAGGPYVAERLAVALGRGAGGGDDDGGAWGVEGRGGDFGGAGYMGAGETWHGCDGSDGPSSSCGGSSAGGEEHGEACAADEGHSGTWGSWLARRLGVRARGEQQQAPRRRRGRRRAAPVLLERSAVLRRARDAAAVRWPQVCEWGGLAARAHLALFYLYGTYYHWEKRLLGVTYTSTSPFLERRASYRVGRGASAP